MKSIQNFRSATKPFYLLHTLAQLSKLLLLFSNRRFGETKMETKCMSLNKINS